MTQLDLLAGLRRKRDGLARAESRDHAFVTRLRAEAIRLSREQGHVHIDDLRQRASALGLVPTSGKSWGAIMRSTTRGRWERVGSRASAWSSNHGHVSPCWRWVGTDDGRA